MRRVHRKLSELHYGTMFILVVLVIFGIAAVIFLVERPDINQDSLLKQSIMERYSR